MSDLMTILRYAWQQKKIRFIIIILFGGVTCLVMVTILMRQPSITGKNTQLTLDSNVSLNQGKLAVYNGSSFYKIDPASENGPEVIYTPKFRLPTTSTVIWADNQGALMNFSSSINYTPVETYFKSHYKQLQNRDLLTWYMDFTDNTLHLVDEVSLQNNAAVYSPSDNGFYYIPDTTTLELDNATNMLRFYDIKAHTSKTVVEQLNISASDIRLCANKGVVCIAGVKYGDAYNKVGVFTVSREGGVEQILSHEGEIHPGPSDTQYLLLGGAKEYQEIDTIFTTVKLVDIVTNKNRDYSDNVFSTGIVAGQRGEDIYYIDGRDNSYHTFTSGLFSTSVNTDTVILEDNSSLNKGAVLLRGMSDTRSLLVSSLTRELYLLTDKNIVQPFTRSKSDVVKSAVAGCVNKVKGRSTVDILSVIVLIPDDEHFTDSVAAVKACIAATPENLLGYTYTYKGASAFDGRISTD